ncbi:MAG: hypothetical protein Q9191_007313 [Dirinaria sp. TL-2023a]
MASSSDNPARFIPMLEHPHHSNPQSPRQPPNSIETTSIASKRALSTSYEPITPPSDDNDPIPRQPHQNSHRSSTTDIENGSPTANYNSATDPYDLSSRLKTASELDLIRAKTSRKRDGYGAITTNKAATKAKRLQNFYEAQNENIARWLKPVDEHVRDARREEGENHLKYKIAVHGSFAANLVLAALQIYGAVSSGSLSLFTTMADAIFDPLSNVTLIICNRAVRKVDARRFPSGKARIETAGNIVFCFMMTAVSFLIIVLSIMELTGGNYTAWTCATTTKTNEPTRTPKPTKPFHLISSIVVGIALVTKIALFAYCWALRNLYSQIRILWEDHRNDSLINGIGLATSILGAHIAWWIDPMGAILLSLLISALWLRTAYTQFLLLIGVSASTSLQQWITYICLTHNRAVIKGIDTVRAYYSGPRVVVEVDVVMDENRRMGECHDVAEGLQEVLERLPDVERAYVHVDWEVGHKPEHSVKKEL